MTPCQLWGNAVFNLCEMVKGHKAKLIIVHSECQVRRQPENRRGTAVEEIWGKLTQNGEKSTWEIRFDYQTWTQRRLRLRSVPSSGVCLQPVKQQALQKQDQGCKEKQKTYNLPLIHTFLVVFYFIDRFFSKYTKICIFVFCILFYSGFYIPVIYSFTSIFTAAATE